MSRTTTLLMPVTILLTGVLWAEPALAAVSVSRAEVSGSQLRIEGTALASRDIRVDGVVMGRSDSGGKFRIERSGYVSPADCTVDLTDGSPTVTSARLSGCTVSSPPPPPPPAEPAALEGLTVNPTSVTGGSPSAGTVTLTAVPDSDLVVSLSSSSAAATVPATVTVPAGATSAQFSISTTRVAASSAVTLTAAHAGVTRSAFLNVAAPAALAGLTVSPTSVTGGSSSTGTITLTSSQDRDLAVSLSSDSTAATVPATVTVPAGAAGVQFTISTSQVTAPRGATITAAYDGVTRTAALTVNPPPVAAPTALDRLTVSPATVTGGSPSTGTVTLTAAAPAGGVSVSLSSDWTAVATVPATVTVPAGATSAQFTVTTFQVPALSAVTITAAYDGVTRSASLTVNPAGAEGLYFITPAQLPDATLGQSYLASIVCSDPAGPSTFDFKLVSGRVPAGTRFLKNTLENRPEARVSGTPTARGTYTFTVEVRDNTGATARRTFTVRVL